MAVLLSTVYTPGASVFFTAQRRADGFWWNQATGAFAATVADADRIMAATEGTGQGTGYFTFSQANWGTIDRLDVFAHVDLGSGAADTIGKATTVVNQCNEVSDRDVLDAIKQDTTAILNIVSGGGPTMQIAAARTWFLEPGGNANRANNVIPLMPQDPGITTTLSMDFSQVMRDTSIESVESVSETGGQPIAFGAISKSGDAMKAHIPVGNVNTGVTYELLVTVKLSDSNIISGYGSLRGQ